jgi:hypothetical protein
VNWRSIAQKFAANASAADGTNVTVHSAGQRVRVTAQLIDAERRHRWTKRYDRPVQDIFAIQDEILDAMAATGKLLFLAKEINPKVCWRSIVVCALWPQALHAALKLHVGSGS